jgi:MerR family mercuric resistance operon transcriptional regulator
MRISELADKAAVNIQTVRFYERRGLLQEPPRSGSGYRCYASRDLETLRFIRRSQELGFTLNEISQLLPLHRSVASMPSSRNQGARQVQAMAVTARRRLEQVEQKLRMLKTMRAQLTTFITRLETLAPTKCLAPEMSLANPKQTCPRA